MKNIKEKVMAVRIGESGGSIVFGMMAVAFTCLLGLPCAADAATWTDVYYELAHQNSQSGNTSVAPANITDYTGQAVSTTQYLDGKVTVSAYALPGVLKASVWNISDVQSVALTGVSDYTTSHAQASYFDQITINPIDPALIGQTATISGSLLLSGNMLAFWNLIDNNNTYFDVYARTTAQVNGTGIARFIQGQENHGNSGGALTDVSIPLPTVIPVSITTTLGSVTGIQYNLDLQGYASSSFGFRQCGSGWGPCGAIVSSELLADYSHSLVWGGIDSVTGTGGNPIAFTVTSASGFDYSLPASVPIPAAVWLFGTGLSVLAGFARRWKLGV